MNQKLERDTLPQDGDIPEQEIPDAETYEGADMEDYEIMDAADYEAAYDEAHGSADDADWVETDDSPAPRRGKRLLSPAKKIFGSKKGRRVVALLLVCALVVAAISMRKSPNAASAADSVYTTVPVQRRSISADITGSGTLEAANSYSVTTLIEGAILTANFEEGDQVQQGMVLYTLDSSDVSSSLEQAELSLNEAQRGYQSQLENKSDLTAKATAAGQIVSLDVKVGDEVSVGQTLATIRDSATMELVVPFPADDALGFYPGQSATVTLDSTFEKLSGTVSKVSAVDIVATGNMIQREVTILVQNPGGISTQQNATAEIGGIASSGSAAFACQDEATVTADASGTVASIHVGEGGYVSKNQSILTISSSSVDDAVQSASENVRKTQLSLESSYKKLEDYTITSPISGTIIDKNYKAGETSEANQVLCTIYDLSYLTMTLNVDELDISEIEVGQKVSILADAVEGRVYEGEVTKVSVAGSSANGVTTYPVTIRIDETEGLRPGMSADATIVLGSAEDVLAIPAAALLRGNQVMVTKDSPSAANAGSMSTPPQGMEIGGAVSQDGGMSFGVSEDMGEYVSVQVTTGVSDGDYIEILSGLQEGDTVAYIHTSGGGMSFYGEGMVIMGDGGSMPAGGMSGAPGGGRGGGEVSVTTGGF